VTDNGSREDRPSIGELVSTLSEKLAALVRSEVALAKAEMVEKAKSVGIGLGLFAGAAVFAFFGTGVLVATMVLGLAEALPAWLAALIVALVLFGITALLGFLGKRSLDKSNPPVPERAQASIKADVEALKQGRAKEGQR
jgi:hypothetical protein